MALFKFRKGGDDSAATPSQPESIEALRRRARHRLIGASVLVLIGVIGFPLVFDTQPRPVSVDIPIDIPDRNKTQPLEASTPAQAQGRVETLPSAAGAADATLPAAPVADRPVSGLVDETPPAGKASAASAAKPALAASKAAGAAASQPAAAAGTSEGGARALALLEARAQPAAVSATPAAPSTAAPAASAAAASSPAAAAAESRFVVQVGAFGEVAKAREARLKLERSGLKTYTQVVETKEGKRIRVRVGPFATHAEADKAAQRIKALDLPAAVLSL